MSCQDIVGPGRTLLADPTLSVVWFDISVADTSKAPAAQPSPNGSILSGGGSDWWAGGRGGEGSGRHSHTCETGPSNGGDPGQLCS